MNSGVYCAAGCGSWSAGTSFQWRGRASKVCPDCRRAKERADLTAALGVEVRDVNRVGLGDRRGLAIEELKLDPMNVAPRFVVYVDGRELFRRSTWEAAYRQGAGYTKGTAYRNGEPKPTPALYDCSEAPGETFTFAEFVDANEDLSWDEKSAVQKLAVGGKVSFGGGAAAETWVRRVS